MSSGVIALSSVLVDMKGLRITLAPLISQLCTGSRQAAAALVFSCHARCEQQDPDLGQSADQSEIILSVSKTRALIQFAAVILNGFDGRGCLPTISMCWSLCMALFTSCHRTAQQFPFVSIDILSPSQKNKTPYFALHMETFSTDRFMLLYLALTHTFQNRA